MATPMNYDESEKIHAKARIADKAKSVSWATDEIWRLRQEVLELERYRAHIMSLPSRIQDTTPSGMFQDVRFKACYDLFASAIEEV